MNSAENITLLAWVGRIALLFLLLLMGTIYARGWARLQNVTPLQNAKDNPHPTPLRWQLAAFIGGLAMTGFALISSLESFAGEFFWVRVIQHILITGIIPLLLFVSDPYYTIKAGLPATARTRLSAIAKQRSHWYKTLVAITAPSVIWVVFVANFWLWYDDSMIAAARTYALVHVIEVVTLLGTACFYWWHIAGAAPRLHKPMPHVIRIMYAFIGMLPIKLMGMVLLFGSETGAGSGSHTMVAFRNFEIADKSLGAILIWVVGGATYTYAATFLAGRFVGLEEEKPALPRSVLEEDSLWIAPGLRR